MNTLKSRIQLIMKEHDLTYRAMADIACVSQQTVYNWLSGGNIKENNAKKIASRLGFDWEWLSFGTHKGGSLLEAAKLLVKTSGGIVAILSSFDLYYVEATEPIVRFSGKDRKFLLEESFYTRMLVPDRESLENNLRKLVRGKINAYNFMTQRASVTNNNITSLLITVLYLAGIDSEEPHFLFIGMPISNSEGLSPSEVLEAPVKNLT